MLSGRNLSVLLKILAKKDSLWNQKTLAKELNIAQSEVSDSLEKLRLSKLLQKVEDRDIVAVSACEEFFTHGLKYIIPIKHEERGRGIATSFAAPVFRDKFMVPVNDKPVWLTEAGQDEGYGVIPLYSKLPEALLNTPDIEFYNILAIVDALRESRARGKNIAKEKFNAFLDSYANAVTI